ncbi:B2 protein-like [Pyrus communis]|uniref:B2 protein-like n=1 Tax=Pyrus communis TaxID=23211 RepID=UPI0035BF222F
MAKDFGPNFLTFVTEEEPQTYKAALESSEAPYWKEAIQSEIESIMQNNTWELVNLPPRNKPTGRKWIFKRKLRLDAIASVYNLEIHQMDVKTAFLNGELDEEIYMEQPEGFIVKGQEKKVRIGVKERCKPLEEDAFRPILYHYDGPKFRLQLSVPEALALLDLFKEENF